MGTQVDWKIFTRFFFQLRSRAQQAIQIKICFYAIKDLPIWLLKTKKIFFVKNHMGIKCFGIHFEQIFPILGEKLIDINW